MNKLSAVLDAYFPLFMQICRFGIVGLVAAAIHFSIVVWLVQFSILVPLAANIVGFAIAFQVSYWGHRWWTFAETDTMHSIALPKLLFVQLLNFAANETLFYFFLLLQLPYMLALLIVLTVLPLFTFIASKWWVFGT